MRSFISTSSFSCSFPRTVKDLFIPSQNRPHRFWGPTPHLIQSVPLPLSRGYSGHGVKLNTHPLLVPRLRMSGIMHPSHTSSSCKLYVYLSSRNLVVRYKFLRGIWCLIFQSIISTCRMGQHIPSERCYRATRLHVVTFQKAAMIITVCARYCGGCFFYIWSE
jgi:hypothetical protein